MVGIDAVVGHHAMRQGSQEEKKFILTMERHYDDFLFTGNMRSCFHFQDFVMTYDFVLLLLLLLIVSILKA